jgi:hypothetical protein
MMVKGVCEDIIVERKYSVTEYSTIGSIAKELFCLGERRTRERRYHYKSHSLPVDLKIGQQIVLGLMELQ